MNLLRSIDAYADIEDSVVPGIADAVLWAAHRYRVELSIITVGAAAFLARNILKD